MQYSTLRRALAALLMVPVLGLAALAAGGAGGANSMGPTHVAGVSLENFGVMDGHIFRGEAPGKRGYSELASIGVRTVIDLRKEASDSDRERAEAAGLRYVHIPMKSRSTPTDAQTAAFIKALDAVGSDKVYVHCAGGRHRTGSMLAVYRMAKDGWSLDQAYGEMLAYDFYTRNGHGGYKDYVEDYYRRMTSDPSSVPAAYRAPKPGAVVRASGAAH